MNAVVRGGLGTVLYAIIQREGDGCNVRADELYKVNIRLSSLNSIFVLKPFTFVIIKLLKKWIDVKNKNILACKKYKKYFENFSEQVEMVKYLCDL